MLTAADKKWIQALFEGSATKKEVGAVRDSVDLLRHKLAMSSLDKMNFKAEFDGLRASVVRTEEKIDKIMDTLDGFAGRVADLDQENKMGARTLRRYGVNIEELAKATKTRISK